MAQPKASTPPKVKAGKMTAGSCSGLGRLQKAANIKKGK